MGQMEAERTIAGKAAEQAARLPDVLERERQARDRADQVEKGLREAEVSIATITQRLAGEEDRRKKSEAQLEVLNNEHNQQRDALQESNLKKNTSTSALEAAQHEVKELRERSLLMEAERDEALKKLAQRGGEPPLTITCVAPDAPLPMLCHHGNQFYWT